MGGMGDSARGGVVLAGQPRQNHPPRRLRAGGAAAGGVARAIDLLALLRAAGGCTSTGARPAGVMRVVRVVRIDIDPGLTLARAAAGRPVPEPAGHDGEASVWVLPDAIEALDAQADAMDALDHRSGRERASRAAG